jgi:proteic killer suppression protein
VIDSFRHKGLQELFSAGATRRIRPEFVSKCERILAMLHAATRPEELNIPGLRFHSLQGSPRRWSVRVSANYRITFGWIGEAAVNIDLEDYH